LSEKGVLLARVVFVYGTVSWCSLKSAPVFLYT